MDQCDTDGLISFEQALTNILNQITALKTTECIPLEHAMGRITATAILSPINIPTFANSAMDGYALRLNEANGNTLLPIAGTALAGAPFVGSWPENSCIRIMTGAAIPHGTDAVIMQEQTERSAQGIRILHPVQHGQNIRQVGEDLLLGAKVLDAGKKLGAAQLPLLASLGITTVEVVCRPTVAILSTGDELQAICEPLQAGRIYDTNRFALRLMLEQLGCNIIDLGIIADNPQALHKAFSQADSQADLVLSSGGVSVGEADYTKQILNELGKTNFWKLAIKPGKPFTFGKLAHAWFCGLPGNPVSAMLTFYQLVQPLIAKLAGHSQWHLPARLPARALTALKKSPGRLDFQRGIYHVNQTGEIEVATTGHQGSHIFSSYNTGNCFIILERERSNVAAGELVEIEPFNSLLQG